MEKAGNARELKYSAKRGLFWLVFYFLMALTPLASAYMGLVPDYRSFWIEFGVAMGFIGLGLFALQFLFSGRFIQVAPSFGMDNLVQFHKEIGIIAFVFVLAHPAILIIANSEFLSYFDPGENLFRAIGLIGALVGLFLIMATSLWRMVFGLSYEMWRLVHDLLAFFLLFISTVHALQVGHYLEPFWKKTVIVIFSSLFAYLLVHTRIVRPFLNRKKPYEIIDIKEERDQCYTMVIRAKNHKRLDFAPGQFIWITVHSHPFSLQQHPFSIASSSHDPDIAICAKEVGDFTAKWKNLDRGTPVFLEGPFGSFVSDPNRPCFLIMGGIGVTPAMSMLRTMRDENNSNEVIMVYGNMNWEEIPFREELEALQDRMPLRLIHVLEEPSEGWKGEQGMLDRDLLARYLPPDQNSFDYFICGPNPFMDMAEIALRELEVDWKKIHSERFEIV